jgi:hypothetical protein
MLFASYVDREKYEGGGAVEQSRAQEKAAHLQNAAKSVVFKLSQPFSHKFVL